MRVELGILHIGRTTAHVHGEQFQPVLKSLGFCCLVFGDDHERGRAKCDAGILVGRELRSAGDHQPDMHAVGHAVGGEGVGDRTGQFTATAADIQRDGLGALVQAIQMRIQEQRLATMHAQAFPDAVAEHETGVEHRHHRFGARLHLAVDVNQDVAIAWVVDEIVGAVGHLGSPLRKADGNWRTAAWRGTGVDSGPCRP